IDPKAAGVVLVAELHGLLAHLVLVRGEGRAAQSVEREEKPAREKNHGDDASARIAIGTRWENLRHLSRLHGSTAGLAEECVGRPPWKGRRMLRPPVRSIKLPRGVSRTRQV